MTVLDTIHTGKRPVPPRLLLYGVEGVGKAQPLDAKVLTPTGFIPMGQIKVGDKVTGSDGKAHRVLGVYPQGEKDVFEVIFRDGSRTCCCDDHLWFTQTLCERVRGQSGAVRSLRDIRRTLRYGTQFNHGVPCVKPIEFEACGQNLPIDPWLFGMYLGDGSTSNCILITNCEPDIQQKISLSVSDSDVCVDADGRALRIKSKVKTNKPSHLRQALEQFGLDGLKAQDKFVLRDYLQASVQQRLELLRGLLDSDGHVTVPGAVEFTTVSSQLSHDVCFLVRSLGGSAKQTLKKSPTFTYRGQKRNGQPAYRIFASFTNGIVPVSSQKHLAKWNEPQWCIRHTIRSVEPIGKMPCQCIRIDAPDSLYVTDDFILTHNSTFAASAPRPVFIPTEDGLGEIDCAAFPLAKSLPEVETYLSALANEPHDYQTVVIDSADWLEQLIWDDLCRLSNATSIEKVDGGYGKGYIAALRFWRQILDALETLHKQRQMVVILIAHAKVERFEDPEANSYDRYTPRLNKHANAILTEWADAVLFATRRFSTKNEKLGFGQERTIAVSIGKDGGERILRTVGGPSCIAKNRYNLPYELHLSWAEFFIALNPNTSTEKQE
jgi:hypothetical protein